MYRNSYYEEIMNLIKEKPMSQNEIYRELNEISLQGIAKHLNKGVNEGKILYLGNKINKKDARYYLKYKYGINWPSNAWQCYLYTPKTEKIYIKLKKIKKTNQEDIQEIIRFYRLLEFLSICQEVEYYNFKVVKRWKKTKGTYTTNEAVMQSISNKKKKVQEFYKNRDKKDSILRFLELTPLMYWIAFKRVVPVGHPEYDANKDIVLVKDKLMKLLKGKI